MRTRRTSVGWAGVLGLVVLGLWPAAPSVGADDESVEVDDAAEAWYVSPTSTPAAEGAPTVPAPPPLPPVPDICTLPIGCPAGPLPGDPLSTVPSPAAAAYPVGTLHVQATGGKRAAHSYVVPDTTPVPMDATLVSGEMVLPLTKGDDSGNVSAETARMVACLVLEPVIDGVAGGVEDAPDFGCQKASSKLKFDEKEKAYVVDLTPFVEAWGSGEATNYGIALVPALDLGPEATWQVTLNGDRVTKGKKATTTLVYRNPKPDEPEPVEEPEPEPEETEPPVDTSGGGGGGVALPAGGGAPEVEAPAPPIEAAAPAAPAPEKLQAAPFALLNSPWYTYRGVVFLPLAFLIAMGLTGRSLTRPLARVVRR